MPEATITIDTNSPTIIFSGAPIEGGATLTSYIDQIETLADYPTTFPNDGVTAATTSPTANTIAKRNASGGIGFAYSLSLYDPDGDATATFTANSYLADGIDRAYWMPRASGVMALTNSVTGVPDALTNGTISGTVAFGPGAQTAMLDALGFGAAGKTISTKTTISSVYEYLGVVTKKKSADLSRNSSSVFATDSDFTIPMEANSTYSVEFQIVFTSTSSCGFKGQFVIPSAAAVYANNTPGLGSITYPPGTQAFLGLVVSTLAIGGANFAIATANTGMAFTGRFIITTGSTAGNMVFQWAQNTSHADNATVHSISNVTCTKRNF